MPSITHRFSILGVPLEADVDYTVTYRGHPGVGPSLSYPGDPPEPPEWNVDAVRLRRTDTTGSTDLDPDLECPQWLRTALEESEDVQMAIYEQIDEEDRHGYDDD